MAKTVKKPDAQIDSETHDHMLIEHENIALSKIAKTAEGAQKLLPHGRDKERARAKGAKIVTVSQN